MRRRDVVSLCVIWGLLLAALAWALATQFRWAQEAKPVQAQRPPVPEKEGAEAPPASATGVIGTIDDDTRAALAKGLHKVPAEQAKTKAPGEKQGR